MGIAGTVFWVFVFWCCGVLLNSVDLRLFVFVICFGICLIACLDCVTVDGFALIGFVAVWWFCGLLLGWFGVRLFATTVCYLCVDLLVGLGAWSWCGLWVGICIGWLLV